MSERKYDYCVVGSGLFGSTFANMATRHGKYVLVVEKDRRVGGNVSTHISDGIVIHEHGAHIFHTSDKDVWEYVNGITAFHPFINTPIANFYGNLFSLPFNMHTFTEMWGNVTPAEAKRIIDRQRELVGEPKNLEEQAIALVGRQIYEMLVKGYTEKQWNTECKDLPPSIIKRLPVRFTFNNNYFDDRYQGIPDGGYSELICRMLKGVDVVTGKDFLCERDAFMECADKIIYTGCIDEFYGYRFGELGYRGLEFKTVRYEEDNHQGVAVMNYTGSDVPYTRSIEHKHFDYHETPVTYVTYEYPSKWRRGNAAYYPILNNDNELLYVKYKNLADKEERVVFGGRLGLYRYYDMDDVVRLAIDLEASLDKVVV